MRALCGGGKASHGSRIRRLQDNETAVLLGLRLAIVNFCPPAGSSERLTLVVIANASLSAMNLLYLTMADPQGNNRWKKVGDKQRLLSRELLIAS